MLFRRKKKKSEETYLKGIPTIGKDKPIEVGVSVKKAKDTPGAWNVTLEIMNNTDKTKKVNIILSTEGEILELPLNVRLIERNKARLENLILQPRQAIKLTGIKVLSAKEPTLSIEVEAEVVPKPTSAGGGLQVSVEKNVTHMGGELFEVLIQLTNESEIITPEIPFMDLVPNKFDIDKESINPRPDTIEETSEGTIISWKLKLNPKEKKTLSYRIRAKTPDADLSDLYGVYGG